MLASKNKTVAYLMLNESKSRRLAIGNKHCKQADTRKMENQNEEENREAMDTCVPVLDERNRASRAQWPKEH